MNIPLVCYEYFCATFVNLLIKKICDVYIYSGHFFNAIVCFVNLLNIHLVMVCG